MTDTRKTTLPSAGTITLDANTRTGLTPWPSYSEEEIDAVEQVLRSGRVNYWTGEECKLFEQVFAERMDCQYGVAVANGTLALELALIAAGIGRGDEVIVTPRTFIASASAVVAVGAVPVFADVDPDSQNITAETIEPVLTAKTKAVICVHLAGWPCDMDPIMALAKTFNLKVIEDCAQAHGAMYKGRSVGSLGDIAAWSFCQDKIMTTGGEGGMITTNDEALYEKAWSYKDHGKSRKKIASPSEGKGFKWVHDSFGSNYRMTEMQAAIGRIQLQRLTEWRKKRARNAEVILNTCREFGLHAPMPDKTMTHAWYKAYAFIQPDQLREGWSRDRVLAELNAEGLTTFAGICPEVYRELAVKEQNMAPANPCTNAQLLGETGLMFLVHPTMETVYQEFATRCLSRVLSKACMAPISVAV